MQKRTKIDDVKIVRRMRLRLLFKRLVRTVVMNSQFMDDEEQGVTMNAKKNVAFLIRQKRKTGILTTKVSGNRSIGIYTLLLYRFQLQDKALLRSSHSYRSIEERRELCMIVASLTCMSRLPPVR